MTEPLIAESTSTAFHATFLSLFNISPWKEPKIFKIGRRPSTTVERLVYTILIFIFDNLDVVLRWALPFDKRPEDRPIESDQWDDAEILRRFDDSEPISPNQDGVKKISDDTLVKVTFDWDALYLEASSFEFVRTHTTIPIPRIRRKFRDEEGFTINVMDYIPGERLDRVWPSLSVWSTGKIWIALILRRYIRELRQIKDSHSSVPGPVADSPQSCNGYMFFDKTCGPFPDYASLSAFYNGKLDLAKRIPHFDDLGNTIHSPLPDGEPFDNTGPLVLIHGDLSMRNIIYGRDGRIWLVDWGMSGFYPRWFEYIAMVYAAENDMAPDSWNLLIPFIPNPLFKHIGWIDQLGVAFIAYR